MDLANTNNVEPHKVDIPVLQEQWFNNPDSYDMSETDGVDNGLQSSIIQSSQHFDIADYIKLNDPKLVTLIRMLMGLGIFFPPPKLLFLTSRMTISNPYFKNLSVP